MCAEARKAGSLIERQTYSIPVATCPPLPSVTADITNPSLASPPDSSFAGLFNFESTSDPTSSDGRDEKLCTL